MGISFPARGDIADIYDWIATGSRARADGWLAGILGEIESLDCHPKRCPIAPESLGSGSELRQLLFGDYRIVFDVTGRHVRVHHVRHGARLPLSPWP